MKTIKDKPSLCNNCKFNLDCKLKPHFQFCEENYNNSFINYINSENINNNILELIKNAPWFNFSITCDYYIKEE